MATFNILTIDGGGLRGIVPLRILQEVQKRCSAHGKGETIQHTFDLMAGTSTGGLIVSCMNLKDPGNTKPRYTLRQIIDMYINDGETIFPKRSSLGKALHKVADLFRPEYSAKGLEKVLKKYIGDETLLDTLRPLLISSYDLKTNHAMFFKTSEAFGDATANARIYDVCRATSAAPTFLPAYSFQYKDQRFTGIDGGVFANNPAMAAVAEIKKWGRAGFYKKKDGAPVEFDDVRVLSLGTGSYNEPVSEKESVSWGQLQWAQKIPNIMMDGVNRTIHYEVNEIMDPGKYLRLDILINAKHSDMTDVTKSTRDYLEAAVEDQITKNPVTLNLLDNFIAGLS